MPVVTQCRKCKSQIEPAYVGLGSLCEGCWSDAQYVADAPPANRLPSAPTMKQIERYLASREVEVIEEDEDEDEDEDEAIEDEPCDNF